jgi:hypothetical protein
MRMGACAAAPAAPAADAAGGPDSGMAWVRPLPAPFYYWRRCSAQSLPRPMACSVDAAALLALCRVLAPC